jgi:transcription-repair coupling factor (superfamily II helicase)
MIKIYRSISLNLILALFGPIPTATQEMIRAIRLRWIAKQIGLEKVVLKQQKLLCYFVSNQDSPYYQSPAFSRVCSTCNKTQVAAS